MMANLADNPFFKETEEDRKYFIQPKPAKDEPKWEKGFNELLQDFEISLIKQALHEAKGNVAKAARICGLKRTGLQAKASKYGIDPEQFRPW